MLPQRIFQDALVELVSREHDVFLCATGGPGPLLDLAEGLGIPTAALSAASPLATPRAALGIGRVIARWRPDVVHAHEALPALAAGIAAAPYRTPVLYHRHHLTGSSRLRLASRAASRATTGTLAVSAAVAHRAHVDDHRPEDRIAVARNGLAPLRVVDPAEVAALGARLGVADGFVLLAVCRLRPEKGLPDLLATLPRLVGHSTQPAHLVIVGAGPEEQRLRAAVPDDRPGEVLFVGHQDDVAPWYAMADVLVMPSHREGLPLVAIEAMASERPIVASAVGGLLELVEDGVTGVLVPPSDPDALAAAILGLWDDPPRRAAMGRAGGERYRSEFGADAMIAGWERGYAELQRAGRGAMRRRVPRARTRRPSRR